jgi:hypothetical protein
MVSTKPISHPDYQKLRVILEKELGRKVSLDEAIATGDSLLKIYEILLN